MWCARVPVAAGLNGARFDAGTFILGVEAALEDRRFLAVTRRREAGADDAISQEGDSGEGDHQPEPLVPREQGQDQSSG